MVKEQTHKEEWWSTQIRIRSESHINNEYNDGKDNDPEYLGEGHSSYSQRDMAKWIQRK